MADLKKLKNLKADVKSDFEIVFNLVPYKVK